MAANLRDQHRPISYWKQHPVIQTYRRLLSYSATAEQHNISRTRVRQIVQSAQAAGADVPPLKWRRGIPKPKVHKPRPPSKPKPPPKKKPKKFDPGGIEGIGDRVYLIHIDGDYQGVSHYLGWTTNLIRRIVFQHRRGVQVRGGGLLHAVNQTGLKWYVVRVWEAGVKFEKLLHRRRNIQDLCPCCPHRTKHHKEPNKERRYGHVWKYKFVRHIPRDLMTVAREFPYCNGFKQIPTILAEEQ